MSYVNKILECLENRGIESIENIEYDIKVSPADIRTVFADYEKGMTRFPEEDLVPIGKVKIQTTDKLIIIVSKNGNEKPNLGLENKGFRGNIETEMSLIRQLSEYGNIKEIL